MRLWERLLTSRSATSATYSVLHNVQKEWVTAVPKYAVILPAAGKSSRFRDKHYKKPFINLGERAVWLQTADRFLNRSDVQQVILVISPDDREEFHAKFGANIAIMGVEVVDGGAERHDSIAAGMAKVNPDVDFVAVHDAVRPVLLDGWIDEVFSAAEKSGAAILALPVTATLKRSANGREIDETVAREQLWEAQTPQVFRRELLQQAYERRGETRATDDAQLVEQLGHSVSIVNGSPLNIKITTKDDLKLAASALKALPKPKLGGSGNPFENNDMWR